jgi:NADH dehydrogenase FAD-containing subunit
MAVGSVPTNALIKGLKEAGIEVQSAGDCVKAPRQILHAVHEVFDIAKNL